MTKECLVLGVFLPLISLAHLAAAGTIPATIEASSQTAFTLASSAPSLVTSLSTVQASATQEVAEKQPRTGNNYALDPFGILQSTTEGQGDPGGESQQEQEKQTTTNKASETDPKHTTSVTRPDNSFSSSTAAEHTTSASKTESAITAKSGNGATQESPSQPTNSLSSISSASPGTNPSQVDNASGGDSDPSSDVSMNSWKIIGIGILAAIGVALLVICTVFHDAILRALCRPFRRRKDEGEILVPDWHRGSWSFGDDGYGIEKPGFSEQDEEGPRIGDDEKGNLAFPLPPISPFPLRRATSTNSRPATSTGPGFAGVGAGGTTLMKAQGNNTSDLPSPRPAFHAPKPLRDKRMSMLNPPVRLREHSESDAYGGIE